jgi:sterol desaturase/sphingolipid hydroxylase (fatty acid hydroxylase superfamily)
MEKHSHVHPITPLLIWLPLAALMFWHGATSYGLSRLMLASLVVSGLLVWTLAEYVLHRWVFHFKPWNDTTRKISYLIHWVHHDSPNDKTRLVMPPVGGLVLALILYGVFRLILGGALVEPFFAAFLVGYLTYDYTHYAVHHFRPRTALGRWVKKHHMDHHFLEQESNWGVSSPVWDHVFGTNISAVRSRKPKTAKAAPVTLENKSTA